MHIFYSERNKIHNVVYAKIALESSTFFSYIWAYSAIYLLQFLNSLYGLTKTIFTESFFVVSICHELQALSLHNITCHRALHTVHSSSAIPVITQYDLSLSTANSAFVKCKPCQYTIWLVIEHCIQCIRQVQIIQYAQHIFSLINVSCIMSSFLNPNQYRGIHNRI